MPCVSCASFAISTSTTLTCPKKAPHVMTNLQHRTLLYCLATLLLLGGFSSCKQAERETHTLRILHTTDVHGNVLGYDFAQDSCTPSGLGRVSTYVAQVRSEYPTSTLLFDGGDVLQGNAAVYYSNFVDTVRTHFVSDAMTLLGYDAAVVGNHDLEATPSVYHRWQRDMATPLLAANIVHSDGPLKGKPYYSPYSVHMVNGVKVAVLGLVTPSVPEWIPQSSYEGMTFASPIATAHVWIPAIQEHVHPDLLIVLMHSGLGDEQGGENFAVQLANRVSGIDLILYGHDHKAHETTVRSPSGAPVLLINPGSHARNVADVTVSITKQGDKVIDKELQGEIVSMATVPVDSAFVNYFSSFADTVRNFIAEPITRLTEPLIGVDALFGPSAYISLLHQLQLDLSEADISFSAPHRLSLSQPADTLRIRNFFDIYPYENYLYKLRLSGQEIKDYLEYSYGLWCGPDSSSGEHLLYLKDQADEQRFPTVNPTFNFSAAAGIDYTVDLRKAQGERVTIEHLSDGRPFSPDSVYTVAVNSYRAIGGGGHLTQGAGISPEELRQRIVWISPHDLRYHLIEWAKAHQPLTPPRYNNWVFIPKEQAAPAIARDRRIIEESLNK